MKSNSASYIKSCFRLNQKSRKPSILGYQVPASGGTTLQWKRSGVSACLYSDVRICSTSYHICQLQPAKSASPTWWIQHNNFKLICYTEVPARRWRNHVREESRESRENPSGLKRLAPTCGSAGWLGSIIQLSKSGLNSTQRTNQMQILPYLT